MSQPNENTPDWLKGDDAAKTPDVVVAKAAAKEATPKKIKAINDERPARTLKGFRIREDYQTRFDVLVATLKHAEGKKGPDFMEEALELLFRKYDKKLAS